MDIFVEITILIAVATILSLITSYLKQPSIISYILTGLIVGPALLNLIQSPEVLEGVSKFGIALLLFIVGLNLSPTIIREVGKVSVAAGVSQIIVTSFVGFLISLLFGFVWVEALYIGVAITFSSTIIILKIFSDKGEMDKFYTRVIIGSLLVQDIVASLILILVSSLSTADASSGVGMTILGIVGKALLIGVVLVLLVKFVLPKLSKVFASSQELLFIFSISWGMGMAVIFGAIGFSAEIGALVAGITLSALPYNLEISSKMRPLRDFFLILFFISLGAHFDLGTLSAVMTPALVLSVYVLTGNALIMMVVMGVLGYNRRTLFLAGLSMAQVSEFSLILITLGITLGQIGENILALITLVALITITLSSYMMIYSEKLYIFFRPYLKIFTRKKTVSATKSIANYDIVLFGFNRIGYDFLGVFKKLNKKFLVVDHSPEAISLLKKLNVDCVYGDADDGDLIDELHLEESKLIISTIPDLDTNLYIVQKIRLKNKDSIVLAVAHMINDAFKLYEEGVDYVIMPHFLGGSYASRLVLENRFEESHYTTIRDEHIQALLNRKKIGHEHPRF